MWVNTREKVTTKETLSLAGRIDEAEDRLAVPKFLAKKGRGQPKQRRCTINSNAKQMVIRLSEEDFSKLKSLSSYTTIPNVYTVPSTTERSYVPIFTERRAR